MPRAEWTAMTQAPPELLINLMDGSFYGGDPFPAFEWMRRNAPAYYDEANDLWALATYPEVKAAGSDPATFSSAGGHRPKFPPLPMLIDLDPPEHHQRRKLVASGFTPRRIQAMEDHVRAVCDQVIDSVCEQGTCDFVRDIAAPLPLTMIGDMLGVPPDGRGDLLRWSEEMLGSQGSLEPDALEVATRAFGEYQAYLEPILDDRRSSGADDDLVGILVQAEIDGDRLDQQSLIMETLLILVGGDETTRHVLSGGMLALQQNPEQLELLRAGAKVPSAAVEEMLRWVSPIKDMTRSATRDVDVRGVTIPAGSELLLLYPSANRDESVFTRPDVFDVTRDPNPHLAFGFGAHFCLGNQLARIELRVMFEQLLTRLPDLRLAGPGPYPLRKSNFISGIETMPVEFTPAPRVAS
jgi:cytochrome P450 family 142 subfamily A polypeptide 1